MIIKGFTEKYLNKIEFFAPLSGRVRFQYKDKNHFT